MWLLRGWHYRTHVALRGRADARPEKCLGLCTKSFFRFFWLDVSNMSAADIIDRPVADEQGTLGWSDEPNHQRVPGVRRDRERNIFGKSRMKKLVALGSAALLLGYPAAGLSADIVGTIVNPAGAPIPGVTVSVQNQAGVAVGTSVSDGTGKYVIDDLATGTYTLTAKGQTAVAYVGDQGITVDWGIAANSQVIAVATRGAGSTSASVSKSSLRDLSAQQVGAGKSDRNNNAVQRGDCAEDQDDGEQGDDAEITTKIEPGAQGPSRRHCNHTERN